MHKTIDGTLVIFLVCLMKTLSEKEEAPQSLSYRIMSSREEAGQV
ncbi:hypothetical protein KP509_1Z016200 [Ceratopteris richardii]|nr:hypothetical protein KP509_1Z016200 [Ceratopteris richardii]